MINSRLRKQNETLLKSILTFNVEYLPLQWISKTKAKYLEAMSATRLNDLMDLKIISCGHFV